MYRRRMFWTWNAWFVTFLWCYSVTRAEVLIDADGGYKNIVVGINPEVPESKIESLLFELEVGGFLKFICITFKITFVLIKLF